MTNATTASIGDKMISNIGRHGSSKVVGAGQIVVVMILRWVSDRAAAGRRVSAIIAIALGGVSIAEPQTSRVEPRMQAGSSGDSSPESGSLRLIDQVPFTLPDERPEDIEKYRWICYVSPTGLIAARRTDESRLFVLRHDASSIALCAVLQPAMNVSARELRPSAAEVVHWDGAFHWRSDFAKWVRYSATSEGVDLEVPGPLAASADGSIVWVASRARATREGPLRTMAQMHQIRSSGWILHGLGSRQEVVNVVRNAVGAVLVFDSVGAMDVSAGGELHVVERGTGYATLWVMDSAGRVEGSLPLEADDAKPIAVRQLEAGRNGWSLIRDYDDGLWLANVEKSVVGRCAERGFRVSDFSTFHFAGDGRQIYGFKPAEARLYLFEVEMGE